MYLFGIAVLVIVSQIGVGLAGPVALKDVAKDTELIFVFLVHRHGDRTPEDLASITAYSTNPDATTAAANLYGYGQLSIAGKQRSYRLGQFIRNRYNGFIAPKYNDSEIYLESTAYPRTRMTLLTALSAVFKPIPNEAWSTTINWEPVPYLSNDITYDPNLAFRNCPTFENIFNNLMASKPDSMAPYHGVLGKVTKILKLSIDLQQNPVLAYGVYDLLRSQINLGISVPKKLEKLIPDLEKAAGAAIDVLLGDPKVVTYLSGVMLQEFFDSTNALINGQSTPRLRWHSAHDANVYAFESILLLTPKNGVPKYNSLLSLELRKDRYGKLFVLPVYLTTPEEQPQYLQVQGCDSVLCSLDQFTKIVSPYAIDLQTWKSKCNWVETL